MTDILGYRGRRVVVTGCASGMGRATASLLLELGAEVHGLDFRESDLPLASFRITDLRDPASIDAAADSFGEIDGLFNCAGLGPTFSPMDIMKVNFIGTRHLTERLLPKIGEGGAVSSIASTAAMGWSRRLPLLKDLVGTAGYAEAVAWTEAHTDDVADGYPMSKEAVVVWTMIRSQDLIGRGVRINCIMPGLTHTPMLTDQIAVKSDPKMLEGVIQPAGRPGTPEEQAFALMMVGSPRASYLNGAALNVDGGRLARLSMGMIDMPVGMGGR